MCTGNLPESYPGKLPSFLVGMPLKPFSCGMTWSFFFLQKGPADWAAARGIGMRAAQRGKCC